MNFSLHKYISSNPLTKLINLTDDDRQKQFIKELSKSCSKGDVVIYYLKCGNDICGFIGISSSKVDEIPCVHIDYLFVIEEYRSKIYKNLDNIKISQYLIKFIISLTKEIKQNIGLRWLALNPDNDKLEKFYIDNFKFVKFKSKKDKLIYLFIAL